MKILNEHNWNDLGTIFRSANPFPSICIDNFLDKDFVKLLAESYPEYSKAKNVGTEFSTVNEKLKIQITKPENFPQPVQALCDVLGSESFLENLTLLSGIEDLVWDPSFTGGGMHLTGPTGILDVHVDFNYEKALNLYRRLNILIYLNPVWDENWGGEVELWDRNVKNCIHSFAPIHNRCVLFETSDFSFHGVTAVKSPANITRNSFAAYFYSKDSGTNSGEIYGGNHSTIFRARPDEKSKKYWSMPVERCVKYSSQLGNKFKSFVKRMLGR